MRETFQLFSKKKSINIFSSDVGEYQFHSILIIYIIIFWSFVNFEKKVSLFKYDKLYLK